MTHFPGYQVLALRTRPLQLSEVIGQQTIVSALKNMISAGKVPHACLFSGLRGTGKTSTARILAKSLCCELGPTPTPCLVCSHCIHIDRSSHEDVLEIDAASHTGVDNMRDLKEIAFFFPSHARYRIFIIDEAHMLSQGAFNALLKTLEEPPANVLFILATTEVHKIPLTVRSRCVSFSFRKVDLNELGMHLANLAKTEGRQLEEGVGKELARMGKGSVRDSLSLLEHLFSLSSQGSISLGSLERLGGFDTAQIAKNYVKHLNSNAISRALGVLQQVENEDLDWSQFLCAALIEIRNHVIHSKDHPNQFFWIDAFRVLGHVSQDINKVSLPLSWVEVATCDILSRSLWFEPTGGDSHLNKIDDCLTPPKEQKVFIQNSSEQIPAKGLKHIEVIEGKILPVPLDELSIREDSNLIFHKFKEALSLLSKNNMVLSSRLRHASLLSLNHDLIVFDPSPTNQLYCRCSAQEWPFLLEALEKVGLGHAKIQGFTVSGLPPPQILCQKQVSNLEASLTTVGSAPGRSADVFFQGSSVVSQESIAKQGEEDSLKNKILDRFPILRTLEQGGAKVKIDR